MFRVTGRVLFIVVLMGAGWLLGDRYGAPEWITNLTDRGFDAVENRSPLCADAEPCEKEAAVDPASAEAINAALTINEAGLDIIRDSEGLRLEAYELGGRSFIGYGHEMLPGEPTVITKQDADELLRDDVAGAEVAVRRALVRPASENQFSAMVSLAYNIGGRNFSRSRVPALFNVGDVERAADAFLAHNMAGGEILPRLEERRRRERALFLTE